MIVTQALLTVSEPPTGPAAVRKLLESVEYEYVEDLKTMVRHRCGDMMYIGYLDAAGNFYPDADYPRGWPARRGGNFPIARVTNGPFVLPEDRVYEFRSGRLILGVLKENGDFIPDLGAKVIPFKDYRYSKDALRIYNLPGKFVEKGKKGNAQGK
jgi:hypothetical protein